VPVVSGGGSPALKGCGDFPMLTEYRAGTYIYNDVMQVTAGAATWDDCAMTVRATVVSRPTEDRAVLVIPNHCCVVTNMMDEVYAVRKGKVEAVYPVAARGKVR
jgi:D-serine deaminase-like pyridoxal phosphate-dependent protein